MGNAPVIGTQPQNSEHKKQSHGLEVIVLISEFASLFFVGFLLSTYDRHAPWANEYTFYASIIGALATVIIFPVLGILGLNVAGGKIRKKDYSLLVWVLLIVSIGFTTIVPARFLSIKIAGVLNYDWTDQATEQRAIRREEHLAENQVFQAQELITQKKFDQKIQLLAELYERVTANLEGEHRIIAIDPANLRITLDTGRTYTLNTDSIIRKTADAETVATYNGIMNGGYKDHTYIFTAGGYQSFQNYYVGVFPDSVRVQKVIDNIDAEIFVIPIPKIVK